jgi:ERCC4-related helicase
MLCQSCSLRNACSGMCDELWAYLKETRNYKTTYVNKEVGLTVVHENELHESLGEYLDNSGSFTEKYGHMFPEIEEIVLEYGTKRQQQVYDLFIHEKMSIGYIATILCMKHQSVHEVFYGRRGQGGLIRKIQKHLKTSGKLPEASLS